MGYVSFGHMHFEACIVCNMIRRLVTAEDECIPFAPSYKLWSPSDMALGLADSLAQLVLGVTDNPPLDASAAVPKFAVREVEKDGKSPGCENCPPPRPKRPQLQTPLLSASLEDLGHRPPPLNSPQICDLCSLS